MRGGAIGVLGHVYRHSPVTEYLWYSVTEADYLFNAHLTRAMMLASLYSRQDTQLEEGNEHTHDMYIRALNTLPYMHITSTAKANDTAAMIDEWKRLNSNTSSEVEANGR